MTMSPSRTEYSSLNRGLEILSLVRSAGRMRAADLSEKLDIPLSTVYRYLAVLRESGFAVEVDGYLLPSNLLAEAGNESEHLVEYCRPVLRRMREQTTLTAILAVRIHTAAVCLDVSYAHPQHKISFRRGQVRALYAGGSAQPLLAFAPASTVREVLDTDFRRYTAATPSPSEVEQQLKRIRSDGYAVSHGHLTPGMVAVGVPVIVDGRCLCSLSLVGETVTLANIDTLVETLRGGTRELLARMPSQAIQEAWLQPDE